MIFSEAVLNAQYSTRIALFAPSLFSECLLHCLDFHHITYSFYSDSKQNIISTDFHIFQTEKAETFNAIKPNIALVIQNDDQNWESLQFENIINGGVLIYHANAEGKVDTTQGFFRKLFFENAEITAENEQKFLETDFSQIPLQISNPYLLENIFGLKLLCQQLGIMEEDFYEALMEFTA